MKPEMLPPVADHEYLDPRRKNIKSKWESLVLAATAEEIDFNLNNASQTMAKENLTVPGRSPDFQAALLPRPKPSDFVESHYSRTVAGPRRTNTGFPFIALEGTQNVSQD